MPSDRRTCQKISLAHRNRTFVPAAIAASIVDRIGRDQYSGWPAKTTILRPLSSSGWSSRSTSETYSTSRPSRSCQRTNWDSQRNRKPGPGVQVVRAVESDGHRGGRATRGNGAVGIVAVQALATPGVVGMPRERGADEEHRRGGTGTGRWRAHDEWHHGRAATAAQGPQDGNVHPTSPVDGKRGLQDGIPRRIHQPGRRVRRRNRSAQGTNHRLAPQESAARAAVPAEPVPHDFEGADAPGMQDQPLAGGRRCPVHVAGRRLPAAAFDLPAGVAGQAILVGDGRAVSWAEGSVGSGHRSALGDGGRRGRRVGGGSGVRGRLGREDAAVTGGRERSD